MSSPSQLLPESQLSLCGSSSRGGGRGGPVGGGGSHRCFTSPNLELWDVECDCHHFSQCPTIGWQIGGGSNLLTEDQKTEDQPRAGPADRRTKVMLWDSENL